MDRFPVSPKRRRFLEAAIRILDLIVYAVVFFAGAYTLYATPTEALHVLAGSGWLVYVWGGLLLGGGLVGFIGRLSRRWLVETPATISAFFGVAIYFVILSHFMFVNALVAVGMVCVVVAGTALLRRWLELQIFGTEPDARLAARLRSALERRTANTVNRSE